MRSDAWLPLIATVISLEFTMALWRRWRQSRRSYLRSWLISFAFYTAGTAALWYGAAFGWDSATFRVFYVCGAFLTTLWLAQGELELLIRPKVARIIGFFLTLTSAIVGFFILAVPFVGDSVVAGSAMPHGKDLFPVPIRVAIMLANILGTVVVVGGTLWSGITHVTQSPYLLGICAFMLLHAITATLVYFQQADIATSGVLALVILQHLIDSVALFAFVGAPGRGIDMAA